MDLGPKNKAAIITGASIGIGLAVAEGLAAEGANIIMAAWNGDRLKAVAERIVGKYGVRTLALAGDVATAAACIAQVASAEKEFGGADALINNAGTGSSATIQEAPDGKWQYYFDLHVMAAVRFTRGFVPLMKKRGGGVVLHDESICAVQPLWYEPIYNTTKAALMMFSKVLSTEVIKDNIRANCINPGLIQTPDWVKTAEQLTDDKGGDWKGHLQSVANEHAAIKRFGSPEGLANFFISLCSDKATYSVGSTYFVDGGMLKSV
jgi:3-oxoacyl-[acyl-carrier protein] reductase